VNEEEEEEEEEDFFQGLFRIHMQERKGHK